MLNIKKVENDKQIVYGEVYAPVLLPDTDGDVISAKSIEIMAHKFMKSYGQGSIDVEHDNNIVTATVVESFIARKGDDLYIPGAWVVAIHIEDEELWNDVKEGNLNGYSFQGVSKAVFKEIEIEIPEQLDGSTDNQQGHKHKFTVKFDSSGNFLGGKTDTVEDHFHKITNGTVTNDSENHNHKFSFVELLLDDQ